MAKTFTNAIVRRPSPEMVHGITSATLGSPDFLLALRQHEKYVEALETCGLEVKVLDGDPGFPDSVFIEDVAVCTPGCAIITNPGAESRNGEKDGMRAVLSEFYQNIEEIRAPGTMEAGDVMRVGNHLYIGLSERTNPEGARQLISILEREGMTGSVVPLKNVLHLKTGVSYLDNNHLLACGELVDFQGFSSYDRIVVPAREAYAANSLWINGTVLVPEGFPETRAEIEKAGYPVITVDVSEFQKLDGGLSCLSLRFEFPAFQKVSTQKAISTFRAGLNCAQAVFGAYAERLGYDLEMALQTTAGFGGGMGHLQGTCGVVTGAFMVIGVYNSRLYPDNPSRKEKSYAMIREFNSRFMEKHKTTNCKELINCDLSTAEGRVLAKERRVHETICEGCMATSISILNDITELPAYQKLATLK